jgi:hypothetical protein
MPADRKLEPLVTVDAVVKGATAGNLLADALQSALKPIKEFTLGSVMLAAQNAKAETGVRAMAQAHG